MKKRSVDRPLVEVSDELNEANDFLLATYADVLGQELDPISLEGRREMGDEVAATMSMFPDRSDVMIEALSVAAESGAAMFIAAAASGPTVEVNVGGRPRVITAGGDKAAVHVVRWIRTWYHAIIARNTSALVALEAVEDSILRKTTTQLDEYQYSWKKALTALRAGAENCADLCANAKGECERAVVASKKAIETELPLFDMAVALASEDQDAFQGALYRAVIAHRNFWKREALVCEGWLAVGPLAFACIANDRGYPIEVESPYLPSKLILR